MLSVINVMIPRSMSRDRRNILAWPRHEASPLCCLRVHAQVMRFQRLARNYGWQHTGQSAASATARNGRGSVRKLGRGTRDPREEARAYKVTRLKLRLGVTCLACFTTRLPKIVRHARGRSRTVTAKHEINSISRVPPAIFWPIAWAWFDIGTGWSPIPKTFFIGQDKPFSFIEKDLLISISSVQRIRDEKCRELLYNRITKL